MSVVINVGVVIAQHRHQVDGFLAADRHPMVAVLAASWPHASAQTWQNLFIRTTHPLFNDVEARVLDTWGHIRIIRLVPLFKALRGRYGKGCDTNEFVMSSHVRRGKKNKEQSLAGSYYYSAMGGWVQHCQGQHLTSLPSYDTLFFV